MSEDTSLNNDKNTSMYDEYLKQVKKQHNIGAKITLQRLYELLKLEDPLLSDDDIYDRIMKDCLDVWQKGTIQNNMPEELKDPERQESGKKGRKKQLVSVTSDGSVAPDSWASSKPEPEPEPKPAKFIPTDPRIADKDLEIGKLQEQLKEQTEQYHSVLKAINDNKNKDVTESKEYKALLSEVEIIKQERDELKHLASMQMKENPSQTFQSAATIKPETEEIEFPAKELSTFFMDCRISKQVMYLTVADSKVIGWQSDTIRAKNK